MRLIAGCGCRPEVQPGYLVNKRRQSARIRFADEYLGHSRVWQPFMFGKLILGWENIINVRHFVP
jgi:hypothetical protein